MVTREGFLTALGNSFAVAAASAVTATVIAFLMAYAVHYTGLPRWAKRLITAIATLPMFLPTITYGFAIIYSFGKRSLLTRLLGRQFFDIYGFGGAGGLCDLYHSGGLPADPQHHGFCGQKDHHCLQGHGGPGPGHLLDRHSSPPCWELWRAPSFRPSSCASPTSASPPQWAAAMRSSPPSSTTRCWAASPTSTGGGHRHDPAHPSIGKHLHPAVAGAVQYPLYPHLPRRTCGRTPCGIRGGASPARRSQWPSCLSSR